MILSTVERASSSPAQTTEPFPAARPSALTTSPWPGLSAQKERTYSFASEGSSKLRQGGTGTPRPFRRSLVVHLLFSRTAASFLGPRILCPSSWKILTMPSER